MQVIKRDGSKVKFDAEKIFQAVSKAFQATIGQQPFEPIANIVADVQRFIREEMTVEAIQDIVEQQIMQYNPDVAKAYILYREQRAKLRNCHPDPNAIADYIHASKYARYLPEAKRRETYRETVGRVRRMHIEKFPEQGTEIRRAFELVYDKRVLPSMRSMQFAGKAIEEHNARMYNCCFTLVDREEVFGELLYLLLCGCGVGVSLQKQHVAKLPRIAHQSGIVKHTIIEDTIVGWADAFKDLIRGAARGVHVEFSYHKIRPAGAPLKVSGGKAPGHFSLAKAIEACRTILLSSQGRHLKPIECLDLICHISSAVLAGGIRRSSLIALFSQDDEEMWYAKDRANFEYDGKNWQRALCNNSVVFGDDCEYEQFENLIQVNRKNYGDPGYIFLDNFDHGTNPCGEIGLDPTYDGRTGFAFCNLVDINMAKVTTTEQFFEACRAASYIATLQATYTDFPYLGKVSEWIAERDALIGVGMTGIMDCPMDLLGPVLEGGKQEVITTNEILASILGINHAKAHTCIKPSGTGSLELGGVSSGIHSHHADRYFRRVTANPNEPPARFLRDHNPEMVEVKPNGDWCITFPMEGTPPDDAINMFFRVKHFYEHWITDPHSISCTFTVKDDEWENLLGRIWYNRIRSATFIPYASDKDIPFCPREAVTTEKDMVDWIALIKDYKPMDYTLMEELTDLTIKPAACDGGRCDVTSGIVEGDGKCVNDRWEVGPWRKSDEQK